MTITYNITLEINGQGSVEIGDALDGLMITSGSADGWEQPTAANCQIGFIGSPTLAGSDQTSAWWLGRRIGIKMTASDGTAKPIFYGRVYSVNMMPLDVKLQTMQITLGLQSPLAEYSGYLVTQDRPVETQNLRLINLMKDARDIAWLEIGNNIQWQDVEATKTWAQYTSLEMPNMAISDVDFTSMAAYTANNEPLDDVMYQYAINNNGFFGDYLELDATTNKVEYLSFYTVPVFWGSSSTLVIDMDTDVLATDIQSSISLSDIYNYVEATNGTVTRSYEDSASVSQFGLRPLKLETNYELSNDIDTMVVQRATGRSQPRQALSSITVDYDVVADSKRLPFLGEPKVTTLTNVPAQFGGDQKYIVRGMTLSVNYYHAEATWQVVPQNMLDSYTSWYQVPSATIWTTYTTETWNDIK